MKTAKQAKLWKNKIDWFSDGKVEEVEITLPQQPPVKMWAVTKEGLALHKSFDLKHQTKEAIFDRSELTITHLESGYYVAKSSGKARFDHLDFKVFIPNIHATAERLKNFK